MTGRAQSMRRHWRANLRLTAALLLVWFTLSFGAVFFARELGAGFFGWPFSFWVAAQGALLVYLLLVWLYSHALNRLDHEHGLAEDD
jgi:putative solute:sodium symporter small subunit